MDLPDQPTRTYVLAGVLVLVLAAAAVWFFVIDGDDGGGAAAPAAWPTEVQPLVDFVQAERGGLFQTPVAVEAVGDDEFAAIVGFGAELAEPDVAHLQGSVDLLRALALITDRRDDATIIDEAAAAVLDGGRSVRYLRSERRIVVRADDLSDLDPVTEIELVGALSEVLHDQHFGLSRASSFDRSPGAVGPRAVAAGVGPMLIERYLVDLPPRVQSAWADHVELDRGDDATAVVAGLVSHPEPLGQALLRLALADTVEAGSDPTWNLVSGLLTNPPRTEVELLQPWAALDGFERVAVGAPVPDEGAEVLAEGNFGASSLYLVMGLRIDPREALGTSLLWAGDAFVLTRDDDGRRCFALAVEGRDGDASDRYEQALRDWVDAGPRQAEAGVDRDGRTVSLRSCEAPVGADPGIALDPATVVAVAANRTQLLAEMRLGGLTRNGAACTADRVVAAIPVAALQSTDIPPEAQILYDQILEESRRVCRNR